MSERRHTYKVIINPHRCSENTTEPGIANLQSLIRPCTKGPSAMPCCPINAPRSPHIVIMYRLPKVTKETHQPLPKSVKRETHIYNKILSRPCNHTSQPPNASCHASTTQPPWPRSTRPGSPALATATPRHGSAIGTRLPAHRNTTQGRRRRRPTHETLHGGLRRRA